MLSAAAVINLYVQRAPMLAVRPSWKELCRGAETGPGPLKTKWLETPVYRKTRSQQLLPTAHLPVFPCLMYLVPPTFSLAD